MSARSPFRSHLLQQWTNSRRSPIVVQQWLHQETIHEDEEGTTPSSSQSRSSPHRRQHSRRSFHSSSHQHQDSLCLSSVDTSPSSPSIALAANSWAASLTSDENRERYAGRLSAGAPLDYKERRNVENPLFNVVTQGNVTTKKHGRAFAPPSMKNNIFDTGEETTNSSKLTVTKFKTDQRKDPRQVQLAMTIDRAVNLSRATNHLCKDRQVEAGEGQPFTFRKFLAWSRSGRRLMDICFEVTLRTTGEASLAREERNTWSRVSAFLVAVVHENQADTSDVEKDAHQDDPYTVLGYSPPTTEGQLEDYASACAAAQTVIHSLQEDGYSTEWVNSSVVKTPAFRSLVKAKPTDRIAALIKVHDRPIGGKLSGLQI